MHFWSDWSDGKKWLMGILSALIIAVLVGLAKFLLSGESGFPEQRVPFSASSGPAFAIRSEFEGTALVAGKEIIVEVALAALSYPNAVGTDEPRRIEDIHISLVEAADGSWKPVRRSGRHAVGRVIGVGEVMDLDPFTAVLGVEGLESLAGHWLVFDIAEQIPSEPTTTALSHAHSRSDLF